VQVGGGTPKSEHGLCFFVLLGGTCLILIGILGPAGPQRDPKISVISVRSWKKVKKYPRSDGWKRMKIESDFDVKMEAL